MKQELLKLIKEGRRLLPHASSEQKLKLLKLIKENFEQSIVSKKSESTKKSNPDYLEEK